MLAKPFAITFDSFTWHNPGIWHRQQGKERSKWLDELEIYRGIIEHTNTRTAVGTLTTAGRFMVLLCSDKAIEKHP